MATPTEDLPASTVLIPMETTVQVAATPTVAAPAVPAIDELEANLTVSFLSHCSINFTIMNFTNSKSVATLSKRWANGTVSRQRYYRLDNGWYVRQSSNEEKTDQFFPSRAKMDESIHFFLSRGYQGINTNVVRKPAETAPQEQLSLAV